MKDSPRRETLNQIALAIGKIELPHPIRVGIDGLSASGKTIFADELAETLREKGRNVIRTGLDGFHNPPEIRHRQGPMSINGYVEDSFDYLSVRKKILEPLGPDGDRRYETEIFDHQKGEEQKADLHEARADSILLFEGVMLFCQELNGFFDFRILVMCSEKEILERAKVRDLAHFGDLETLLEKYENRFLPGQKRYFSETQPDRIADLIFFNDDPEHPRISLSNEKIDKFFP
jgi:uridine kinase